MVEELAPQLIAELQPLFQLPPAVQHTPIKKGTKELLAELEELRRRTNNPQLTICPKCNHRMLWPGGSRHMIHHCPGGEETYFCYFCLTLLQREDPISDESGLEHFPHGIFQPCCHQRPTVPARVIATELVFEGKFAEAQEAEMRYYLENLRRLRNERLQKNTKLAFQIFFLSPCIVLSPLLLILSLWNTVHKAVELLKMLLVGLVAQLMLVFAAIQFGVVVALALLWMALDWFVCEMVLTTALLALVGVIIIVLALPPLLVWFFMSGFRSAYDLSFILSTIYVWKVTAAGRVSNPHAIPTNEMVMNYVFLFDYYYHPHIGGETFQNLSLFSIGWALIVRVATIGAVTSYFQNYWLLILLAL